jgi:hypothetical protein
MITAIVKFWSKMGEVLQRVTPREQFVKSHGRMAVDVMVLIGSREDQQDLSLSEKPESLLVQSVHPEL